MARRDDPLPPPPPPERSHLRFVLVDIDGTPGDIQNLTQTLVQAVRASQQPAVQPRTHAPLPLNGVAPVSATAAPAQPTLFDGMESDGAEIEPEVPPAAATPSVSTAPPKPTNGSKKTYRTPQLVSTIEFNGGEKSLADYIKEMNPKDHSKRYLAITQWLKQYRAIDQVSGDHVYTCYRALGLNVPKDVLSVFRAIKAQGWVKSGTDDGTFVITHVGENKLTELKGKE